MDITNHYIKMPPALVVTMDAVLAKSHDVVEKLSNLTEEPLTKLFEKLGLMESEGFIGTNGEAKTLDKLVVLIVAKSDLQRFEPHLESLGVVQFDESETHIMFNILPGGELGAIISPIVNSLDIDLPLFMSVEAYLAHHWGIGVNMPEPQSYYHFVGSNPEEYQVVINMPRITINNQEMTVTEKIRKDFITLTQDEFVSEVTLLTSRAKKFEAEQRSQQQLH